MKFSAALLAAAVGVSAHGYGNGTDVVVTETVSSIVTYCPGPTEITHGSNTYTVTEATTLTITDCPCTITRPVTSTPVPECTTCVAPPPSYNTTVAPPPPAPTGGVTPTQPGGPIETAGAGKAAALSGAGLAGIVGLAAFVL